MGADNYKEFDSASIISSAGGKGTITVGKVTLRKREALLGLIALIALLLVIILAIVLAVEVGKSDDCVDDVSAQKQTGQGTISGDPDSTSGTVAQVTSTTAKASTPSATSTTPTPPMTTTTSTTNSPASEGSSSSRPSTTATTTTTTMKPPTTVTPDTSHPNCLSPQCLRAAYYEKVNMNENQDPCADFYEFACGGYADANPQSPLLEDVTPPKKILLENTERLIYLLDFPVDRNDKESHERKLKHFMKSCTDHFDRMEVRGRPFHEKVLKPFGGWYLLGRDLSNFDFMDQLKKVHIKFWTSAFFRMAIATDQTNWQKKILELDFGGVGIDYRYYGNQGAAARVQALYKAYMKQLAQLFIIDAGSQPNMTLVQEFVDDVYDVEHNLSKVILTSPQLRAPHHVDFRKTVGELQGYVNNTINFLDYFDSIFVQRASKFTDKTPVAVMRLQYFQKLGVMLKDYLSDETGRRRLHNYLVWQLMNRYAPDLSWDYIHSKRQLDAYLYGRKDDSSGYAYCFRSAERSMRMAMGAVFVKQFYRKEDKDEAVSIMNLVQSQMVSSINSWTWMTEDDRKEATSKIQNSLYKIGYPDSMNDHGYVDSLYSVANITEGDYFGNILNLNEVHKQTFNRLISHQNNRDAWAYHVFQPAVEYYNPWHELIATAAVLQNPLFDHSGPDYYNYGGMGSIMATNLMHAVDEIGSNYRTDRQGYGSWWDNSTKTEYLKIKQCAVDAQRGQILGPFDIPGVRGNPISPNISLVAPIHAPQMLADAAGVTLSYRAYKVRERNNGQREKIPPGFPKYTVDQMFFIAYAQSYCQNTPDRLKYSQLTTYKLPSKNRVNLAVSHSPDFRKAFNCPKGSLLVPDKICTLIK